MADVSSYNYQEVVQNSAQYLNRDYSVGAEGRKAMETRELQAAEEAIKNDIGTFGMLVKAKIDANFGPRVREQIIQTAENAFLSITSPLHQWLEDNEKVFDEEGLKIEFNQYAYQLFTASQYMAQAASEANPILGINKVDEDGNPIVNQVAKIFDMPM